MSIYNLFLPVISFHAQQLGLCGYSYTTENVPATQVVPVSIFVVFSERADVCLKYNLTFCNCCSSVFFP